MTQIQKSSFKFLKDITEHNNRDWFAEHKEDYQSHHNSFVDFSDNLIDLMRMHDNIETPTGKKAVMRIYRDVRFSKNKAPYKTYSGMSFKRGTQLLRGGYYVHIEPGNSFVGGGFWGPNKDDLLRIRKGIETDQEEFRTVLNSDKFKSVFGVLEGEQLKTCPKGFDKDSTAIDLLRYKQFLIKKDFSDDEVLKAGFLQNTNEVFEAMRPFFDLMSYILTTDANGVPLFEE
ncbi:MAG: hypothetical protein ACI9U0_000649 [Flavobacteriales bacterium]|jgi:uncharacterized protein (TIGR02453 family)|tara:strand:- start:3941 stop:4630 length:690 start_codon:yes stop_codon:yes gene_type:complete